MIEWIKDRFWPKQTYRFPLINARTGERDYAELRARSEYDAVVGVRFFVDTGVWIIGPAQKV